MKKELTDMGLSDKEAQVYLVCLKTGESTANRIAGLCNLPRSTIYDVLEKLKHIGLITSLVKDKKTYFTANNPDLILKFLDEKEKESIDSFKEKKDRFKKISPELKKIQNIIHKKPVAEVFEGIISVSKVIDEIAENATSLKIIGSQQKAIEKLGYRTDRFRVKRKKTGFKVKQILEESQEARKEKKDKLTQVKFLKSLSDSHEGMFIYENTVVHLIESDEIIAIRIKSKEYTQAREIIFNELWKIAKD